MNKHLTICYFGIYRPAVPRDGVYLEGLKKRGIEVIECVDNSSGLLKFFRLAKKLRILKNQYDIIWVGYLSTMVVPLARLVSRRKIVFNSLDSWYDRTVLDRGEYSKFSPKALLILLFDFLAFHMADTILVESEQQKLFIAKKFFVSPKKLEVAFTGVDENVFHPDSSVIKAENFTVVFRGMFLPATGVEVVIEAARILKNEDILFRIIGWGQPLQDKLKKMILDYKLQNVNLTTVFLPPDELRRTMLSAHVMLGQFADHERLNRTIQNKNFEALALGMPFVTRDSASNRELLTDGENCFFVPAADAKALAAKIVQLKNSQMAMTALSHGARLTYTKECKEKVLAEKVFRLL